MAESDSSQCQRKMLKSDEENEIETDVWHSDDSVTHKDGYKASFSTDTSLSSDFSVSI